MTNKRVKKATEGLKGDLETVLVHSNRGKWCEIFKYELTIILESLQNYEIGYI